MINKTSHYQHSGLSDPAFDHDSCGFGLLANINGHVSHEMITSAVEALCRLTHRGAIAADGKSGDGCGLLFVMPDQFVRAVAEEQGFSLGQHYAVGMTFFGRDEEKTRAGQAYLTECLESADLSVAGWRRVPVQLDACGVEAEATRPSIWQVFIRLPATDCEARLYAVRRRAEKQLRDRDPDFYVCSLSSRLLCYKGLVMPAQLPEFYPDLSDTRLMTSMCLFHQRFSTNTLPRWDLAQPFRHLAHNGEINTIQGNRSWAEIRSPCYRGGSFSDEDLADILPVVSGRDSDSCSVDNMLEFMSSGGMDFIHAMRVMMPPAWQNRTQLPAAVRSFYRYYSRKIEPWDGPAGIVATDGRIGSCIMDRNGLRPARYLITNDGFIAIGSEFGIVDCDVSRIAVQGRLRPGEMIAVDVENNRLWGSSEIEEHLSGRHPYAQWLDERARTLDAEPEEQPLCMKPLAADRLPAYEKMFLLSFEEREQVLRVLAENGQEAIGSMGDDTPLPALSAQVRSLYDSFRQSFAQVTNPAIDSIRERDVMSLRTWIGAVPDLFVDHPEDAAGIELSSPVLSEDTFRTILDMNGEDMNCMLDVNYDPDDSDLEEAIIALADQAVAAARNGCLCVILSDRGIRPDALPAHMALVVGAVHNRLRQEKLRHSVNLIVETATTRDPHHFAVLLGYGATAIYPYLAYETLHSMFTRGSWPDANSARLGNSYRAGINKGLYKVLSKMGISTIASYRGSRLFEIVGLHDQVVSRCFTGTVNRIQGLRFSDLESDQRVLAVEAWNPKKPLRQGGLLKFIYGGEFHAYKPDVVQTLQEAVTSGDRRLYQDFSRLVHSRPPTVLRDFLGLAEGQTPISIDEVEPVEKILPRFDTAGMSLGALSPPAHESLAQAMNRLGGCSNSGEGGESDQRFGTDKNSRIKQVASGRFGVTPHYLVNADVLQIKIAQGAKPGEGGQLPGHKVDAMIARLRHCEPGVSLISPPPHHDIYSIEDMAQLIYDLKQVNPKALVSVKLVANAGVGTIAAGVAKAYADMITIAGYDGGTGASPLTSVKYAGGPWEMGLSETHQVLRQYRLREKVRVQADGGLKTGLDVVKAAMLGAESFGFGTAPMIAMGCKYLRICHLNNCATGIATQNRTLYTDHFKPDAVQKVVNYFTFIAQEVRELMAELGIARFADLIGRVDLLTHQPGDDDRHKQLCLLPILHAGDKENTHPHYMTSTRNPPFDKGLLAKKMTQDMLPAIENKADPTRTFSYDIRNSDRSIGAMVSGEIARRHGNNGLAGHPITVHLRGTAGQSLGVWNAGGLHLRLSGTANDYVGKGMAGGLVAIQPDGESQIPSQQSVIMGNACLYGATGGRLHAAGIAGERFAVRNSGTIAVVEGLGDHGCEYMTGGIVIVLGATGLNFGAGMTGGIAFVYDPDGRFNDCCSKESVDTHRIIDAGLENHSDPLRGLIAEHAKETGSAWSMDLCQRFSDIRSDFWLVCPKSARIGKLLDYLKAAA